MRLKNLVIKQINYNQDLDYGTRRFNTQDNRSCHGSA